MLHLAAVVAVTTGEVDEDGLALLFGIGLGLLDVVEALEATGHMQTVGILAVSGQGVVHHGVLIRGAGNGDVLGRFINGAFNVEILRVHRRQEA